MAKYTIDKIEYSGNVYNLQDNVSGYIPEEKEFGSGSVTSTMSHGFSDVYTGPFLGVNQNTTAKGSWVGLDYLYGVDIGSTSDVKFSGTHIGVSSSGTIWVPTNDGDFTTKSYVDDAIAAIPTIPSITLNGSSSTSPSFYAPTSAGTNGYYLMSNGSGAPTWAAIPAGTDEKLKVESLSDTSNHSLILNDSTSSSTSTKLIADMYFQRSNNQSTFNQSTLHIGSLGVSIGRIVLWSTGSTGIQPNTNNHQYVEITLPDTTGTLALTSDIPSIPTIPTISLNGSSTTSASFYAPTTAGTSGQVLQSNGSGAPTWTNSSGHILYGTTAPSAADGVDGDIYCVYS